MESGASQRLTRARANSNKSNPESPSAGIQDSITKKRKKSSSKKNKPKASEKEELEVVQEKEKGKMAEGQQGQQGQQGQTPEKKPEEITPPNSSDPKEWMAIFNKLNITLQSMNNDIAELKGLKTSLDSYTPQWQGKIESALVSLENDQQNTDFKVKLLTNVVIRQDQKLQELESRVTTMFEKEKRQNVVIEGIQEKAGEEREDVTQLVKNFFKHEMKIEAEIEIHDIYRVGRGNGERPIIIKLKHQSDKSIIFKNASNLKGKKNAKKRLYFVKDDMTPQQQEQRTYFRELTRENQEKDEEENWKLKWSKVPLWPTTLV